MFWTKKYRWEISYGKGRLSLTYQVFNLLPCFVLLLLLFFKSKTVLARTERVKDKL